MVRLRKKRIGGQEERAVLTPVGGGDPIDPALLGSLPDVAQPVERLVIRSVRRPNPSRLEHQRHGRRSDAADHQVPTLHSQPASALGAGTRGVPVRKLFRKQRYWRFGASVDFSPDRPFGMLFTDRGIYRPGDTVRIKLVEDRPVPGSSVTWDVTSSLPSVLQAGAVSRNPATMTPVGSDTYTADFLALTGGQALLDAHGTTSCEAMLKAGCPDRAFQITVVVRA